MEQTLTSANLWSHDVALSKSIQNISLNDSLSTSEFDELLVGRFTGISFNRTLRVPEDGKDYPLPAGFGRIGIYRISDYAQRVPQNWLEDGGFFIPLYQKEALYLEFSGSKWHPSIAKIGVGMINAISGKEYSRNISSTPQDYLVVPEQKWLDGINFGNGIVRQFVAMPIGRGFTIEEQITDEGIHGGFQITVINAIDGRFAERDPDIDAGAIAFDNENQDLDSKQGVLYTRNAIQKVDMGMAAGGNIRQNIHRDLYGINTWNNNYEIKINVRIVNSEFFEHITGLKPPPTPILLEHYHKFKIPWFSNYDEKITPLKKPVQFNRLQGVNQIEKSRGDNHENEINNISIENVIRKIFVPDKSELIKSCRDQAILELERSNWMTALNRISLAIDINKPSTASDFIIRCLSNIGLNNYKDASTDASIALQKNPEKNALTISQNLKSFCKEILQRHDNLLKDAAILFENDRKSSMGFGLMYEAYRIIGDHDKALNYARNLFQTDTENLSYQKLLINAQNITWGLIKPSDALPYQKNSKDGFNSRLDYSNVISDVKAIRALENATESILIGRNSINYNTHVPLVPIIVKPCKNPEEDIKKHIDNNSICYFCNKNQNVEKFLVSIRMHNSEIGFIDVIIPRCKSCNEWFFSKIEIVIFFTCWASMFYLGGIIDAKLLNNSLKATSLCGFILGPFISLAITISYAFIIDYVHNKIVIRKCKKHKIVMQYLNQGWKIFGKMKYAAY